MEGNEKTNDETLPVKAEVEHKAGVSDCQESKEACGCPLGDHLNVVEWNNTCSLSYCEECEENPPSVKLRPFRCGSCGSFYPTICSLHKHIQGHGTGGSYHFDNKSRTAYPKYDSVCKGNQADSKVMKIIRVDGVDLIEPIYKTVLVDNEENTRNVQVNPSSIKYSTTTENKEALRSDEREECPTGPVIGNTLKENANETENSESGCKLESVLDGTTSINLFVKAESSNEGGGNQAMKRRNRGMLNEDRATFVEKKTRLKKRRTDDSILNHWKTGVGGNRLVLLQLNRGKSVGIQTESDGTQNNEELNSQNSEEVINQNSEEIVKSVDAIKDVKPTNLSQLKKRNRTGIKLKFRKKDVGILDRKKSCVPGVKGNVLQYTCFECRLVFKADNFLQIHMEKHQGKLFCDCCSKAFSSLEELRKHVLDGEGRNSKAMEIEYCSYCHMMLTEQKGLKAHLCVSEDRRVVRHCMRPFRIIPTKALKNISLNKEESACNTVSRVECEICHKYFANEYFLTMHSVIHKYIHKCSKCILYFLYEEDRNQHDQSCPREILDNIKEFRCEKCLKDFKTMSLLKHHLRRCPRAENRERKHKCEICRRSFFEKCNLKRHMVTAHCDERPFVCEICAAAFKTIATLRRHSELHMANRPIASCDICGTVFKNCHSLGRHRKKHTEHFKQQCSYCGKMFTERWNLNAHMRQHTGEKPYKCDVCGQGFTHNVSRKNHMKKCEKTRDGNEYQKRYQNIPLEYPDSIRISEPYSYPFKKPPSFDAGVGHPLQHPDSIRIPNSYPYPFKKPTSFDTGVGHALHALQHFE